MGEITIKVDEDFDISAFQSGGEHTFSLYDNGDGAIEHLFSDGYSEENFESEDDVDEYEFKEQVNSGDIGTDEDNVNLKGELNVERV